MSKDERSEINRKMKDYIRRLVSSNGLGLLLYDKLVNYAQTIGYDEANHDRLLREGLRQDMMHQAREFTKPGYHKPGCAPFGATTADRHDVDTGKLQGDNIKVGDIVHKDIRRCSVLQLSEMIEQMVKQATPIHKYIAYAVAVYEARTSQQYKLPFNIPIDIQMEMKAQADKDLREDLA